MKHKKSKKKADKYRATLNETINDLIDQRIHEAANDNGFSEDHYLKGAHIIGKMYMTHLYKKQSHFSIIHA